MSLITKIPGMIFTDTSLPKLYRDSILNPGSKFLFDFVSPYCNPNADGNIVSGAAFTNLVNGAPSASANTTGSAIKSLPGKAGLLLDGVSGANLINLGNSYSLHASNPEFIVILWLKIPSVDFKNANYTIMFGLTQANANASQFYFDTGIGGIAPRPQIGFTTGGPGAGGNSVASGVGQGAPMQLAMHWSPGVVKSYANGALIGTVATAKINTLFDCSAANAVISGGFKGTIYRVYQENLAISGKSGAAQILADYKANVGRFV